MLSLIEQPWAVATEADRPATSGRAARAFVPGLVTARLHETWDFYTERLGFFTVAEHGVYVRLEHPCGAGLALLQEETDGTPAPLVTATDGRGFWLRLDVPEVDALHAALVAAGVPIVEPPNDKPWGERLCFVRDPNGVVICLAQERAEGV